MENMKSIKKRVKSIENTKQITKSMQLVSTAKIQRARKRLENSTPFFEETKNAVLLAAGSCVNSKHPYVYNKEVKSSLIIVVGGDRGLCGGYNSNVSREAESHMLKRPDPKVITIGIKIRDYFRRRRRNIIKAYSNISDMPSFEDAAEIGKFALTLFNDGEVDEIYLAYTKFHNMLNLEPVIHKLLPLEIEKKEENEDKGFRYIAFEPDTGTFLKRAVPHYVMARIYEGMVEAEACQHSATLTNMDAAVNNSDKLIEYLSLQYNKLRQSGITQEITEIVGGSIGTD
ncbi:ATP synthase F1 subunit gamma [Anaeropeptidivorans aminofermentans]|jgi:F-type H+-transporting ATPase subunit gamma|uniref:ATP synthase F1 subunit gamma n=1 Tax=Anaeropeptidivorans aminofermentans TaxID=2934315 RepID=UPI002023BF85|nr:ATP synthase F1 subunit gamma [Anaeropeptidivorans aminofermentans]MBE6011056.1 ATP synthase F1 subunit gamma [Lachnospiraceae bacterium]